MKERSDASWILIAVSVLFAALLAGCGGDRETTAKADSGEVGSITGDIAPAIANVEIQLFRNGQQVDYTKTDLRGHYAFTGLAPGTYEVLPITAGFKPLTPQAVAIGAGQVITKDFTLEWLSTTLTAKEMNPMSETLETLANRLSQLEATVQQLTNQVSRFIDELSEQPQELKNFKTSAEMLAYYRRDKAKNAEIFQQVLKKMGISGEPTISIEELQRRMVKNGIRPEDNEFSRAIIEERDK